jgi:hypothetical protein
MALRYPVYLNARLTELPNFSENALAVLRLQAVYPTPKLRSGGDEPGNRKIPRQIDLQKTSHGAANHAVYP